MPKLIKSVSLLGRNVLGRAVNPLSHTMGLFLGRPNKINLHQSYGAGFVHYGSLEKPVKQALPIDYDLLKKGFTGALIQLGTRQKIRPIDLFGFTLSITKNAFVTLEKHLKLIEEFESNTKSIKAHGDGDGQSSDDYQTSLDNAYSLTFCAIAFISFVYMVKAISNEDKVTVGLCMDNLSKCVAYMECLAMLSMGLAYLSKSRNLSLARNLKNQSVFLKTIMKKMAIFLVLSDLVSYCKPLSDFLNSSIVYEDGKFNFRFDRDKFEELKKQPSYSTLEKIHRHVTGDEEQVLVELIKAGIKFLYQPIVELSFTGNKKISDFYLNDDLYTIFDVFFKTWEEVSQSTDNSERNQLSIKEQENKTVDFLKTVYFLKLLQGKQRTGVLQRDISVRPPAKLVTFNTVFTSTDMYQFREELLQRSKNDKKDQSAIVTVVEIKDQDVDPETLKTLRIQRLKKVLQELVTKLELVQKNKTGDDSRVNDLLSGPIAFINESLATNIAIDEIQLRAQVILPIEALHEALSTSGNDEDFGLADVLKAVIDNMVPPPPPPVLDDTQLLELSDLPARGLKVKV